MTEMVPCHFCDEPVEAGGSLIHRPQIGIIAGPTPGYHWECFVRQLVGGLNHQLHLCTCDGGTLNADPEGMTARQAARVATAYSYTQMMALFDDG